MQGAVPVDQAQPTCVAHVVMSVLREPHAVSVPPQVFDQAQPLCAAQVVCVAKVVQADGVPEHEAVPALHEQPSCAVQVAMDSRL